MVWIISIAFENTFCDIIMITWNKLCPCKYFTRAYLGVQYSSRIDLMEVAAFYPSGGKGGEGAANSNISPLYPKYCIVFRHPRDFTNKVPGPPWFYQQNSGTLLNFPTISWSEFSFFRSSKVRSSVFHCICLSMVAGWHHFQKLDISPSWAVAEYFQLNFTQDLGSTQCNSRTLVSRAYYWISPHATCEAS
jgi:hypothetical protein